MPGTSGMNSSSCLQCCTSDFCNMAGCGDQGKTHNQCCTSDFCNIAWCGDQGKIHNQCCTSDCCNMTGCGDQGKIINQCCPSDFCYMPWCGDQNTPNQWIRCCAKRSILALVALLFRRAEYVGQFCHKGPNQSIGVKLF